MRACMPRASFADHSSMASRWDRVIFEGDDDCRPWSDTESEDAQMMEHGDFQGSGDESDGDLELLGGEIPPALMSLDRPGRRSVGSSHGEDDDIIVASTPPELLQSNPQLRASRRFGGSRQIGEGRMRADQTTIPYRRCRSGGANAASRRSSGVGLGGMQHLDSRVGISSQPSVRGVTQPSCSSPVVAGRRVLRDISNVEGERGVRVAGSRATKRSRQTGLWTDDQLSRAMHAVKGGMRIQTAANLYRIPPSSLRDHLYGITRGRKRGGKCVLSAAEEQLIVDWVIQLQQLGHPIILSSLRMKVADICQSRETPFTEGIPGRGWLRWWRRRHPELTLRVAQGLETSRARGLCEENVQTFYQNLKQLYDTNSYSADRIWNCDETGAQAGRNGGALVLARKGTRTIHQVMPDEREWLSVLVCVNVAGQAIPSFYVFKGKRFRRNYIASCESGATMAMQPRAWMTSFLFSKWISHFVKSVARFGGISCERRHLLILDGHVSHVSIDTVVEACRQGLDLLTLPLHTSHAMQPLDVCLFKPFKTAFKAYRDYWTYRAAGSAAKKENLAQWVSLGLRRALTVKNIEKGFKVTGIWPWDGTAMAGKMGPSQTYRPEVDDMSEAFTQLHVEEIQQEVSEPQNPDSQHFYVAVDGAETMPGEDMSTLPSDAELLPPEEPTPSITNFLTLPEVTVSRPRRRAEPIADYSKSIILTSDSYIFMMEDKAARREAVEKSKEQKRQQRELQRKRRDEEKLKEQENKKIREDDRARKKAFDAAWTPSAVSAYGQRLHDRIRSREPLPANTFRAPFLGLVPSICRENQRLAIERRRAKRRREDASAVPPANPPEWVHKPGAPLWSRVVSMQAQNPSWVRTPDAARHLYLRPYEQGRGAEVQPNSPIAGVLSGDFEEPDSLMLTQR